MKALIVILALQLGAVSAFVHACTCVDIRTFCETINRGDGIDSSWVVVLAEVRRHTGNGMEIQVEDVLFGAVGQTTIQLRKGNGGDCQVNTDQFDRGNKYLFALWSFQNAYSLSTCGVTWLEVRGETVTGSIAPGIDRVRLDAMPEVTACEGLGNPLSSLHVGPNPANRYVRISSSVPMEQPVDLRVYDIAGRRVLIEAVVIPDEYGLEFDTSNLPAGVYLVQTKMRGFTRSFKIVVQST